jgi:hypothetical protein
VQGQLQYLEVRPQDRACSASALGLLPHGFVPQGCGDRDRHNWYINWEGFCKSEECSSICKVADCVNKTVWKCVLILDTFWSILLCHNFETEINDLMLTYSGNLYLLCLNKCTLWEIRSLQVNLLSTCEWMRLFLKEKISDRNAQDCVSKLRICYLVTWQRTLQEKVFCP